MIVITSRNLFPEKTHKVYNTCFLKAIKVPHNTPSVRIPIESLDIIKH